MPSSPTLDPAYLPGSYDDRNDEARQLFQRGELEQAAAICQRIIDRISRLPERRRAHGAPLHDPLMTASILLAEIYAKQNDWPALDDLCTHTQAAHPVFAQRWAIEPFMLRIQYGQPQEGIRGLQALAKSEPDNFYFWRMLAQAALDVEDLDLALAASDHADQMEETSDDWEGIASHHIVRFRLLQKRGEWHEAAREWNSACLWDNEMEELREIVVRMFLEAGLYDDALAYVNDESLTVMVGDYYRAWIANQRGDQVRARYLWRKIVERNPNDEDNAVVRALAYCQLRQPEAALAVMLEAVASGDALNTASALALALAWAMLGDAEATHANLKLAVKRSATAGKPQPLLAALDWVEFEQLVEDEALKAELQPHFEAPRTKSP